MARADVTSFNAANSKGVASYTPAAANTDGYAFVNNGKRFMLAENSNAATRDITVQTPVTVDGLAVSERVITIPVTTGRAQIGPFGPEYTQVDGKVYIDFSAVAGLTVSFWELS